MYLSTLNFLPLEINCQQQWFICYIFWKKFRFLWKAETPIWVSHESGTQLIEPPLLLPKLPNRRKLESVVELGCKTKPSDMGCESPNQHLNFLQIPSVAYFLKKLNNPFYKWTSFTGTSCICNKLKSTGGSTNEAEGAIYGFSYLPEVTNSSSWQPLE